MPMLRRQCRPRAAEEEAVSRYGAWTVPGSRETARLAWREYVGRYVQHLSDCGCDVCWRNFRLALSTPKPWRSPRRPDPRRKYPRSHRRACAECRDTVDVVRVWMDCEKRELQLGYDALASASRDHWTRWRRDPHGRRS